jgi:hypothetical protein
MRTRIPPRVMSTFEGPREEQEQWEKATLADMPKVRLVRIKKPLAE